MSYPPGGGETGTIGGDVARGAAGGKGPGAGAKGGKGGRGPLTDAGARGGKGSGKGAKGGRGGTSRGGGSSSGTATELYLAHVAEQEQMQSSRKRAIQPADEEQLEDAGAAAPQ